MVTRKQVKPGTVLDFYDRLILITGKVGRDGGVRCRAIRKGNLAPLHHPTSFYLPEPSATIFRRFSSIKAARNYFREEFKKRLEGEGKWET